ncbi:UvrD-helicase domain-containing protein [Anaerobacillus sp. HL2]|nr:UvrD-helicase domain-containing protein [Anaerobacillus sp. HL2]
MLLEKQIPANRLLLVTFTTKAAKEMKSRMSTFKGITTKDLSSSLSEHFIVSLQNAHVSPK